MRPVRNIRAGRALLTTAAIGSMALLLPCASPAQQSADGGTAKPSRTQTLKPGMKLAQSQTRTAGGGAAKRLVTVNFADVDVRLVLATVASYTGSDVLVMPGATGAISISLRGRTADEAIHLVAATAGLSSAKIGGSYVVGTTPEVRNALTEFGQSDIVPLKYLTPADAKTILARVTPNVGVETTKGAIVLSGLPEDLEAAGEALRRLDVPAPAAAAVTQVAMVTKADPAAAERVLREAFPGVQVARQERTLILTGQPAALDAAHHALTDIDVQPPASDTEEAVVYELKYLNAQKAEESLKKALPQLKVTAAPEPVAPPAANFEPLSTSFLGGSGSSSSSGGFGGGGFGGGGGGVGGSGSSGGGYGGGSGQNGSGAAPQPLSRATKLILIGEKSDVQMAKQLLEATDVDPSLVRIEAAMVEVNVDNLKEMGIKWDINNFGFTFTVPPGNGLDINNVARSAASFKVSLQALITQGKAHILASPNISVIDNEDASIFIGDMLRYNAGQVAVPNVGTVTGVETIPVGIILLVRPRIHPDGNVTLKVHPVVSNLKGTVAGLPQTSSREADTTVRLKAGEELVIGGLSRKEEHTDMQKVPILGDIPVLGELFRTRTHQTSNTEIIIILRAYPVVKKPAPPHDFTTLHEPDMGEMK
jgi:type II secretory pathway component GspD/PulD (secretin)